MKRSLRESILQIPDYKSTCFSACVLLLYVCLTIVIPHLDTVIAEDQSPTSSIGPMPKYYPNSILQSLNYSHFVPLNPLSDSPGNQVKLVLNYNVTESSLLYNPINAIMEVYASNNSLIRTSSLPHPLNLTSSEGTIQLATTLNDHHLKNVTVVTMLTDDEKTIPISNILEARFNLGEMTGN